MRIFFILCTFIVFTFTASAQPKKVSFGVQAGAGPTWLSHQYPSNPQDEYNKTTIGYSAGAFVDIELGKFTLRPALSFAEVAGSATETFGGDIIFDIYGTWRMRYLQLPVNLLYNIPSKNGAFQLGFGAYAAKALSGNFKPSDKNGFANPKMYNQIYSRDANIGGSGPGSFSSTDFGLNAIAGYQFTSGMLLNVTYSAGLTNVHKDDYYLVSTKTGGIHLIVGYRF